MLDPGTWLRISVQGGLRIRVRFGLYCLDGSIIAVEGNKAVNLQPSTVDNNKFTTLDDFYCF